MTIYIVVITCIVSLLAFQNDDLKNRFVFNAVAVSERGEWWRFITSGFIHGNIFHLLWNMLALYSFGPQVEAIYNDIFPIGSQYKFFILYFGAMVISMLPSYKKHKHDSSYSSLGASGAIVAVVFVYILYAPLQDVCLYGILCIPGVIMGVAFLGVSYYYSDKRGNRWEHRVHLWGAIFGIVYTLILKPQLLLHFISQISSVLNR